MSDHDSLPPDPDTPKEPEHHGVVETLRDEIHDVVEHVPQPVRWTVGKLVRVALLSLVLLVVLVAVSAALYLANRTELVARELTLVLNQTLARRSDLVLVIRDVKGNPLTGFRLIEPRVQFRDDGTPLLAAHEMRVNYSAWSLLQGGTRPVEIALDRPTVRLDGGPKGTWRLPRWENEGPRTDGAVFFGLSLNQADVSAPAPLGHVRGLDLRMSGNTGPRMRVGLERMRWRQGPWHSRLEQFTAELRRDGDSLRVRVGDLRTGDLALAMDGAWREHGPVRLHADVRRVRWRWLSEVFDNEEFDVDGEGRVQVDALHDRDWTGGFAADLSWDSLAVAGSGRFGWDGRRLALDSLAGRSRAGNFTGRLRWSNQGWTLEGDARDADPAHWHALRLDGWPAGRLAGSFRYVLDSRGKANRSALDVALLASQWSGWDVDSARVRVDFPEVARDSFAVTGWRRGGRFTLAATVDRDGWAGPYTLDAFPLEEWPDGRASGLRGTLAHGAGRVDDRGGELRVTGDLEGAVTDWSAAHFARWQLRGIEGRLLPKPDLTASAHAQDGFFVGIHVDSADAEVHLGDQTATFSPLHATAGDTVFTASGSAAWEASHWRVLMTSATAASAQFAWVAEPPLVFSGDEQGTLFDRVIADDGAAHLEARGRWASPGGAYDFGLDARGLDLGRLGMPADWGLGGHGEARLAVSGRSGDPGWTFDGRASQPGFGGHRCDTLAVALAGRQHTLELRELLFGLEDGTARASGRVERTLRAWPDSITATAVLRWLQGAGGWTGRLDAKRLPVGRLSALAPAAEGWGGVIEGSLVLGGSPDRPRVDLDASGDDLGWRDYRAQHVEAHAGLHDGVLEVARALVTMQDVVSTVSGSMPVTLALGRPPEVPDESMHWTVDVPRGDLKLLPALVPLVQSARGRFDLKAAFAGTTRHPRLTGSGHIRDGTLRPAGREEFLDAVHADLHFDENRIVLDSLSARQGRTGSVWGRGAVDLAGFDLKRYAFDLHMRDFAASQEGLYAMLFDGDFQVVDGPRVLGQRLPQVLGDVHLKRGVVEFDFANQSEVQKRSAVTEPLYWTYRIHLDAPSNLRWQPPDGDIEFSADLLLEQTPDSLLIYGGMQLVKGHYFFLSNRFTLSQADLTFDNQKGVDPTIEILAETRLQPSRSELASGTGSSAAQNATEVIDAHLSGRSSQPVIELSSSSGWDQREILGELTYGRFSGAGVSPTDPVSNYLTRQLSNQLSRDLSKFFNDAVNQWELEREQGELFGGQGGVVMRVGGALTPRTSWVYRQKLPGLDRPFATTPVGTTLFDRDVEVQYRINRFIYATTELTQRRVGPLQSGQNGTDFNVNLKARWEY